MEILLAKILGSGIGLILGIKLLIFILNRWNKK